MQYILILTVAFCLLTASNCKKHNPQPKSKDPVTLNYYLGDVKDYCVFKPGTYWVYQNDLTGDIDSHWVSSCAVWKETQKGTETWSKHITLVQELFEMVVKSSFTDGLGNNPYWEYYTTGANVDTYPEPHQGYVTECHKVWKMGTASNFIFRRPYFTTPNYPAYQIAEYSKMTLNSIEYDSVKVFRVASDGVYPESKVPTEGTGNSDYYFAKNYGIIKIYIQAYRGLDGQPWNQTWSLVRKNIVQ